MGAYDGKDWCPEFEYVVHEGDGAVVRRVIWVVFVIWFTYELGGACAPFFWVYQFFAIIVKKEKMM